MEKIDGFYFAGIHCGIKSIKDKKDLGIFISDKYLNASIVHTKNQFKAAPVLRNNHIIKNNQSKIKALLVNSGVANACSGLEGYDDAEKTAETAAETFNINSDEILTASTGIIGQRLPIDKMKSGISSLKDRVKEQGYTDFAESIMTTDTFSKIVFKEENGVKLIGMCKGAGMIAPSMATMLSFFFTNIPLGNSDKLLADAVDNSFNIISVDGDMSTNDTVILLSPYEGYIDTDRLNTFKKLLNEASRELSMMILKDGEGITKIIKIKVSSTHNNREECKKIANAVSKSQLVKTAMFGCDMNWGRILASAGSADVLFNHEEVSLIINGDMVFRQGGPVEFDYQKASVKMKEKFIDIQLIIGEGYMTSEYIMYFNDLTIDYVKLNSLYTT